MIVCLFDESLFDDGFLFDVFLLFGHAVFTVVLDELVVQDIE